MESMQDFETIYYNTRDALLRYLVPRIRSSADVEDLMQEIYTNLYRHLSRSRTLREPLPYLYAIAKKTLSRYYRRRAVHIEQEEPLNESLADDAPTVEELTLSREQMREIWSIVKSEPLASYQAFTLYYGFSVPTDEIAKELNLSEDAVRKRLSRTRNRIRRQLNIEQDSEGV